MEQTIVLDYCSICYAIFITFVLLLYMLFDVNYFLRISFCIGWAKLLEKKKKVFDQTEVFGIVTTNDLDIMFKHMNNARFVRELDFARFHFYERTGMYEFIIKQKGHILQTATNIRYRRTMPLFTTYKITTKIISWDEKTLYLEQQFVSLSDGFVRAVILTKQNTLGIDVEEMMAKLTEKDKSVKPAPPPELADWLSSMEKSSARLRKKD